MSVLSITLFLLSEIDSTVFVFVVVTFVAVAAATVEFFSLSLELSSNDYRNQINPLTENRNRHENNSVNIFQHSSAQT